MMLQKSKQRTSTQQDNITFSPSLKSLQNTEYFLLHTRVHGRYKGRSCPISDSRQTTLGRTELDQSIVARDLSHPLRTQKLRLIFQMPVLNCLMCQIVFLFANSREGKLLSF